MSERTPTREAECMACCIHSVGSLQEAVLWKSAAVCSKDVHVFLIMPGSG